MRPSNGVYIVAFGLSSKKKSIHHLGSKMNYTIIGTPDCAINEPFIVMVSRSPEVATYLEPVHKNKLL